MAGCYFCPFQILCLLACFISELTSETLNPCRYLWLGFFGDGIDPSQNLYLHRTAQERKSRTYIHASNGIRNDDPSVEQFKIIGASDCAATGTG